jgi:hypothetical protein
MPSSLEITKVLTPEERLRKYRQLLGKLATEESMLRVETEGNASDGGSGSNPSTHGIETFKPAEHSGQVSSLMKSPTSSSPEGKNRIMLKVKQRSIDSEIDDVRRQREDLERRYEKGRISREEYEHELEELIKRGQTLLLRKAEVCKELEAVGHK